MSEQSQPTDREFNTPLDELNPEGAGASADGETSTFEPEEPTEDASASVLPEV